MSTSSPSPTTTFTNAAPPALLSPIMPLVYLDLSDNPLRDYNARVLLRSLGGIGSRTHSGGGGSGGGGGGGAVSSTAVKLTLRTLKLRNCKLEHVGREIRNILIRSIQMCCMPMPLCSVL
jgi:hypothetical protein